MVTCRGTTIVRAGRRRDKSQPQKLLVLKHRGICLLVILALFLTWHFFPDESDEISLSTRFSQYLSATKHIDEWLLECAAELSQGDPAPFHPEFDAEVDKIHLYRLGDCLRKCACEPGHGNGTMLTQYSLLAACPPYPFGRGNITLYRENERKGVDAGNNMAVIEQLFQMREGQAGFVKPDPNVLVIHLRLGDIVERSEANASTLLRRGGIPSNFVNQWLRSVHEYLHDIYHSNAAKIEIVGGSHTRASKKSRVYAGCLKRAIALSGYAVSMRTDGYTADQDFYYVSHAKKLLVSPGGFSALMGNMAKRHGGTVVGRNFDFFYKFY